jgi:hypothetical protein
MTDFAFQVAQNAILALGIMGAGTNNARMAGMLRNLSSYYSKEPSLLFLVRRLAERQSAQVVLRTRA